MKNLIIRCIGKLPETWQHEAAQTYLTRLQPFTAVDIVSLPEGHGGSAKPDLDRTRKTEAESLLKGIPTGACIIALDETGKEFDSPAFASKLADWSTGGRTIVFLIGGSWGLDQAVRDRADAILSLGKMTWPHGMARVMLLEQLYRTAMINAGKTYHK
jgi:23S rRNA (pseudouridine1915-N3)-methyltransferase